MATKIIIDKRELLKQAATGKNRRVFSRALRSKFEREVNLARGEMIREFDEHPVTQEIEGGIESENISGTIKGSGNLFGFIGFKNGSDPISPVREALGKKIKTKVTETRFGIGFLGGGKFKIVTNLPDKEDIYKIAEMPWAKGLSWAEGIEEGISGIGNFLFKRDTEHSRSNRGLQIDKKVKKSFRPLKGGYISKIYNDFFDKLKRL